MALRPARKTLSSLTGILVLAAVLWLLLNFVYAPACGRFACSYEPAWIPVAEADAGEGCPDSIQAAAGDADWAAGRAESIPRDGRKTSGLMYDSDGAEHSYTSGEKDAAAAEATAVLKEIGAPASPIGTYPAASHVEVKAAAAMRTGGVTHGVLVINHSGGPCTGDLGCTTALPLVLTEGATLTVWWPTEQGMQSQQFTGGPA